MTRYLTCAETAKLVRIALKRAFLDTKFSVRSQTYSGGASIDVSWTDGPLSKRVDEILGRYEGKSFDGSIDMAVSNDHYLLPDGSVRFAHTAGTEGSMGYIPAADAPHPINAEQVHFGANYVHSSRHLSNEDALREIAATYIREHCHCDGEAPNDRFGNEWVRDVASAVVRNLDYTESGTELERFQRAYHRAIFREEPTDAEIAA